MNSLRDIRCDVLPYVLPYGPGVPSDYISLFQNRMNDGLVRSRAIVGLAHKCRKLESLREENERMLFDIDNSVVPQVAFIQRNVRATLSPPDLQGLPTRWPSTICAAAHAGAFPST